MAMTQEMVLSNAQVVLEHDVIHVHVVIRDGLIA